MDDKLPMGLRFSLLHRAFKRRMDALLSEKELTGVQFGVLGALIRRERQGAEEISQRDLEEATHVGHPNCVRQRISKFFNIVLVYVEGFS